MTILPQSDRSRTALAGIASVVLIVIDLFVVAVVTFLIQIDSGHHVYPPLWRVLPKGVLFSMPFTLAVLAGVLGLESWLFGSRQTVGPGITRRRLRAAEVALGVVVFALLMWVGMASQP